MGACEFVDTATGKTPEEAFSAIVEDARHEHGHGGYTGTIAEKGGFVMVPLPDGIDPRKWIDAVMDGEKMYEETDEMYAERMEQAGMTEDLRRKAMRWNDAANDKWGPACCIKVKEGKYMFFGWASS